MGNSQMVIILGVAICVIVVVLTTIIVVRTNLAKPMPDQQPTNTVPDDIIASEDQLIKVPASVPMELPHPEKHSLNRWEYGDQAVSISVFDGRKPEGGALLNLSSNTYAHLEALLEPALDVTRAADQLKSTSYLMEFQPEVLRRIDEGSASIMKSLGGHCRAMAVDQHGEIIGQAEMIPVSGLTLINVTAGVFQLMALVSGQHYLAAINGNLSQIKGKLDEIQTLLEDQLRERIASDFDHLEGFAQTLIQQDYEQGEVASIDGQLLSVIRDAEHALRITHRDIKRSHQAMVLMKMDGAGYERHQAQYREIVEDYAQATSAYISTVLLIGVASQMRRALPVNRGFSDRHFSRSLLICNAIASDRNHFRELAELKSQQLESFRYRPSWKKKAMHDKDRTKMVVELNTQMKAIEAELNSSRRTIQNARQGWARPAAETSEPVKLLVSTGKGHGALEVKRYTD